MRTTFVQRLQVNEYTSDSRRVNLYVNLRRRLHLMPTAAVLSRCFRPSLRSWCRRVRLHLYSLPSWGEDEHRNVTCVHYTCTKLRVSRTHRCKYDDTLGYSRKSNFSCDTIIYHASWGHLPSILAT